MVLVPISKEKNKTLEDLEDASQNIWKIPIPKSVPSVSSENSGKVVGFICWGEQSPQEHDHVNGIPCGSSQSPDRCNLKTVHRI